MVNIVRNMKSFAITFRLAALASATLVLSACAAMHEVTDAFRLGFSNYTEPPENSPHALLRVSSDGNVAAFPASACQSGTVPNSGIALSRAQLQIGAGGLNGQKRGVPGSPLAGQPYAEFRVPAGVPFTLFYASGWGERGGNYGCAKGVYFTPQTGAAYEFVAVTIQAQRLCGVRLRDLAKPEFPVVLQDAPRC